MWADEARSAYSLDAADYPIFSQVNNYILVGDNSYNYSYAGTSLIYGIYGDFDTFKIFVDPGSNYTITSSDSSVLSPGVFDSDFAIYDTYGYLLATSTDYGSFSGLTFTAYQSTYLVQFYTGSAGYYSARLGNNSIIEQNGIGEEIYAGKSYSASLDYSSDVDIYRCYLQAGVNYEFGLISNISDIYLDVEYNQAYVDSLVSSGSGIYSFTAPYTGYYELHISSNGFRSTGDYVLLTDITPPTIYISSNRTNLTAGQTATITFTLSEPSNNFSITDITVAGGTISSFSGSGSNYLATFTPNPNSTSNGVIFVASGTFTDGAGNTNENRADTQNNVILTVNTFPPNSAPTASNGSAATAEDTALSGTLPSASDADSDRITYTKSSDPNNGSVTISDSGKYSYTPASNFNGSDTFKFSVSDGKGGSSTYTQTIIVNSINDAPTAQNVTLTTNEDTARVLAVADFGFSDVDAGNTLKSVTLTSVPAAGSLKLNGVAVKANQVVTASDLAAGKLVFSPAANANGSGYASFGFKVSDGNALSASAYTATVNVTAVNDAPTAQNVTLTTNEDTARVLTVADFGFSDVDAGDSLKSVTLTSVPAAGSLKLNGVAVTANQLVTAADLAAGKLVFSPAANANGNGYASFSFKVSDGNALSANAYKASVNVTAVNDPGSVTISGSTTQGQAMTATVSDVDGVPAKGVSYQWLADGVAIAGATAKTLTLGQTQVGKAVSVKASYTDKPGTAESVTSAVTTMVASPSKTGTSGNDVLGGSTGSDLLDGLAGKDVIYGGQGNDTLVGGSGADTLTGGLGADNFKFTALGDLGLGATARDMVVDFKAGEGDKIDLASIDANLTLNGDQAFSWVNNFSIAAGEVRFAADGQGNGVLSLNTDADLDAEFEILLTGVTSLTAADLVL
jgi:Bacterial Ig-like domain/Cadherin-like domain/Bacterial Ig domain/RTX calcium-binding nonapeptide repeat (4 copies)